MISIEIPSINSNFPAVAIQPQNLRAQSKSSCWVAIGCKAACCDTTLNFSAVGRPIGSITFAFSLFRLATAQFPATWAPSTIATQTFSAVKVGNKSAPARRVHSQRLIRWRLRTEFNGTYTAADLVRRFRSLRRWSTTRMKTRAKSLCHLLV